MHQCRIVLDVQLPQSYPIPQVEVVRPYVQRMMTDFDDEEPTLKIPRETMQEASERSAPARIHSAADLVWNPLAADPEVSDGVPKAIEDDATTEPHTHQGAA